MSRDTRARSVESSGWSVQRGALNGAFCGALVGIARLFVAPEPGFPAAYYVGVIIGFVVFGGLLGILIAALRNASRR